MTLGCGRVPAGYTPPYGNQERSSLPLWFPGAPCWLRANICLAWDGLGLSKSIGQLVGCSDMVWCGKGCVGWNQEAWVLYR